MIIWTIAMWIMKTGIFRRMHLGTAELIHIQLQLKTNWSSIWLHLGITKSNVIKQMAEYFRAAINID